MTEKAFCPDDDFGDGWDEAAFVRDGLTRNLRQRICGWPSYERDEHGAPKDGYDHGHTDCYLMGLAADEIDRLHDPRDSIRAVVREADSNRPTAAGKGSRNPDRWEWRGDA